MTKTDLDRALGPTPPVFGDRVADTLRTLKEETDVKRKSIRRTLVIALILLLIAGVAVALIVAQGQDWYYHNRFTAYQENEPEKQQAILGSLTADIPQEQTGTALVTVTVQDASWAPEEGIATLSFAVRPVNPEGDELHSILNLDEDGCWSDTLDPDDPDSRTEHWLWTDKGYGPPAETMADPAKRLVLFDDGDGSVFVGTDGQTALPGYCTDQFQGEDGAVICVMEFDLTRLDAAKVREQSDALTFDADWGLTQEEWAAGREEDLHRALRYANAAGPAVEAATDKNGMLTLRYPYRVVPFADNALLTDGAVQGEAVFRIKVR